MCTTVSLNMHLTVSAAVNTGTLSIENITESDFGMYRCTSTNVAGTSICELKLHAGKLFAFENFSGNTNTSPKNSMKMGVEILLCAVGSTDSGKLDSMEAGYVAAIVVGIVLGLVLIGVAIWLIVRAVNAKKYKGVNQEGNEMR